MRSAALAAVLLAGCAIDSYLPDELMLGHGRSYYDQNSPWGGLSPVTDGGEGESYSAALVWHLPSVEGSQPRPPVDMSEPREDAETPSGALKLRVREGAEDPPAVVMYGLGGALLLFIVFALWRSRRADGWH